MRFQHHKSKCERRLDSEQISYRSKVGVALSAGSESDEYLTPKSSYLASEDRKLDHSLPLQNQTQRHHV